MSVASSALSSAASRIRSAFTVQSAIMPRIASSVASRVSTASNRPSLSSWRSRL